MRRRTDSKRRKAWWPKLLILGVGTLLLGFLGGYLWLLGYLRSDSFRQSVETELASTLGAEKVSIDPLRWDGWSVDTKEVAIQHQPYRGKPLKRIQIERLQTEFDPSGLRQKTWRLKGTDITHIHLELQNSSLAEEEQTQASSSKEETVAATEEAKPPWWMPTKHDAGTTTISRISGEWLSELGVSLCQWDDVRLEIEADASQNEAYFLEAQGGTLKTALKWMPKLSLQKASAQFSPKYMILKEASLRFFKHARLSIQGEVEPERGYHFDAQVEDLSLQEILPKKWETKIMALAKADFSLISEPEQDLLVEGNLELESAYLGGISYLDLLAEYVQDSRLKNITFNQAQADFRYQNGEIKFSNIRLESQALFCIKGDLTITKEKALIGNLQLGIAPGMLNSIPGAETQVFVTREEGLMWTPVRISGTLARPKEDLSVRILAAAGTRLVEFAAGLGMDVVAEGVGNVSHAAQDVINSDTAKSAVEQLTSGAAGAAKAVEPILNDGKEVMDSALDAGDELLDGGAKAVNELLKMPFRDKTR